jgi:hypothetical protein
VDGHPDKIGKNFEASVTGEAASRHAWDDEGHMTVCHSDNARLYRTGGEGSRAKQVV